MVEKNVVEVYALVSVLCVAAAALSFAAEATKIKVSDIVDTGTSCIYPKTLANLLGYMAATLVLFAQIVITVVTRCACCQKNATSKSDKLVEPIICYFVSSWVVSVMAMSGLSSAAYLSSRYTYLDAQGFCYTVKEGIFAIGGGLALITGILGLCAYNSTTKYNLHQQPATAAEEMPNSQSDITGIAIGHPQFNNNAASLNPCPKQQQFV